MHMLSSITHLTWICFLLKSLACPVTCLCFWINIRIPSCTRAPCTASQEWHCQTWRGIYYYGYSLVAIYIYIIYSSYWTHIPIDTPGATSVVVALLYNVGRFLDFQATHIFYICGKGFFVFHTLLYIFLFQEIIFCGSYWCSCRIDRPYFSTTLSTITMDNRQTFIPQRALYWEIFSILSELADSNQI